MPELRILTEHLVKTSVERSIASLLDRQRELEAKVERSGGPSFDKPRDFEATIQAAIAPLFDKQRELEMKLGALRHAEVRPQPSLGGGAPQVAELSASSATGRAPVEEHVAAPRIGPPPLPTQALAPIPADPAKGPPPLPTQALAPIATDPAKRPPPLPTQAVAQRPIAFERPAMDPQTDALAAAARSANALVDIPRELNGSRRKRLVVFLLLLFVIGILATVASLSVMSNMGAYP